MINIDTLEELDKTLSANEKCVIKIGTETCGPCRLVKQTLEKIEKDYDDITFIEVDADECENAIVDRFNIRNIPVVLMIKSGEVVNRVSGVRMENQLREDIKAINI